MATLGYEAQSWKEGILVGHLLVFIAAAYCYWIVRRFSLGFPRLVASTPALAVYTLVPFIWSHDTHLTGVGCFYCIVTWIASFKVLLLCWGTGAGCDPWVEPIFPRFAIVMMYPAHVKQTGKVVKRVPVKYSSLIDYVSKSETWYMLFARSVVKSVVLALLLQITVSSLDTLPLIVLHLLTTLQLYLFATTLLEVLAAVANFFFGVTIEPHFDNPFVSVSLQEFWGQRWNLLVSSCLRETVYNPVLHLLQRSDDKPETSDQALSTNLAESEDLFLTRRSKRSSGVTNTDFSKAQGARRKFDLDKLIALLASFLVSGIMHEGAVYYMTWNATWRMTSFFVVHGVAVALETAWKIQYPKTRPSRVVSTLLTLSFTFITAHWLFWPPVDCKIAVISSELLNLRF